MCNKTQRPNDYKEIISMNIQFVTDLVTHINPSYHVQFPSKMNRGHLTTFNSKVYDESVLKATLNSSVRFTTSTRYSSALIDFDIAENLLNFKQMAPGFAAWWYSDGMVYLFRLDDQQGGFNANARILSKDTPASYIVNPKNSQNY